MATTIAGSTKRRTEMEKSFSPLNWILVITGCRLYPSKNDFVNLIDHIQAISLLFSHSYLFYHCFPSKDSIKRGDFVNDLRAEFQQILGILFIIIMRKNRVQLRNILQCIERSLTPVEFKKLYMTSIVISIPHWISLVAFQTLRLVWGFTEDKIKTFTYWTVFLTEFNCWIFGGVPVLVFYLDSIHMWEETLINTVTNQFSMRKMSVSPSQVSIFIQTVINRRNKLMAHFSCLPCSWCLYVFAKSVVTITGLSAENDNLVELTYDVFGMIEWISFIFMIVYIMIKTELLLKKSCDRLEILSNKVLLRHQVDSWIHVLSDIKVAQEYTYMSWDIIPMNKAFVLSFVLLIVVSFVLSFVVAV